MKPWYQKKEFLRLRKEWYARLAADGFNDIEITDWASGDSQNFTLGLGNPTQLLRQKGWAASQEYYYQATHYIHVLSSDPSVSERDRRVWALHADGVSMRRIAKEIGISTAYVGKIVKKHRTNMLKNLGAPAIPEQGPQAASEGRIAPDTNNVVCMREWRKR
jgi:DNA-binding CsgD family transcriptional regulator